MLCLWTKKVKVTYQLLVEILFHVHILLTILKTRDIIIVCDLESKLPFQETSSTM